MAHFPTFYEWRCQAVGAGPLTDTQAFHLLRIWLSLVSRFPPDDRWVRL